MENSSCIVSVAFREPYLTHSKKQESVINGVDYLVLRDELPTKDGVMKEDIVTHFQKSLYGFKPHAIQRAIDLGYKKIVWFDPSVLPVTDVKVLFNSLDTHPMIVVLGDAPVTRMANQKSKDWFGVKDEELDGVKHIGGTIYGFNFNNPKALETFNLWKRAEEEGIFGNQDEFMKGHWADEACMSLAMYKTGVEFYKEESFKYLNQKEYQEYTKLNP